MWSGGVTVWAANPRHFARRLAADMRRTFPQLGDVKIDRIWSGTLGRPVHNMPQIGEFSRGLWLAGGFSGHGLNTTAMAGELLGRGIVEGDQTWRLFSPYDLVWAGGTFGRAAVQAMYWKTRISDLFDARFTQRPVAQPTAEPLQDAPAAQDIAVPQVPAAAPPEPAAVKPGRTKEKKKASKKAARRNKTVKKRASKKAAAQADAAAGQGELAGEVESAAEIVSVER
jgi:hypothetical protein